MTELEEALIIARATYELWLGVEPEEIEAAFEALRDLDPTHRSLPLLAGRLRRSRALRAMVEIAQLEAARVSASGNE